VVLATAALAGFEDQFRHTTTDIDATALLVDVFLG
jgi:hypothetical protein